MDEMGEIEETLPQHKNRIKQEEKERTIREAKMNRDELLYKQEIQDRKKEIKDIEEKEKQEEGDKDKIDESREYIKMYEVFLKDIETIRLRFNEEREEYRFFIKFHEDQDKSDSVRTREDNENLSAVLEQRRRQIIKHNKLPINIPLPPYGDDQEYKDMINDLLLKVGNPGIIKFKKPTKTEAGFVNLKVLAMYCHADADKRNYKKLADKLKGLFLKKEKTLYEDTGEEYNLDSILDDVCSYLGLEGSYLGLEGGRRNKTKTSKYKKRKTNKSKKSRKHIRSRRLSRSRRPVKSRRYKKSRK